MRKSILPRVFVGVCNVICERYLQLGLDSSLDMERSFNKGPATEHHGAHQRSIRIRAIYDIFVETQSTSI
jgi:hypothetical protein